MGCRGQISLDKLRFARPAEHPCYSDPAAKGCPMTSDPTPRTPPPRDPRAVAAISDAAARVRQNVERVIVARDQVIEFALVAMLCAGHILIEDVPGIGKTVLAKSLARSVGCSFKRIQFTPDLMPSDITGINFYNQKSGEFEFRAGPIIANIVLADEINRATPRTQSALLEAMEERQITIDGVTTPLPAPFLVLATQNPVELEGTFPLPEAQLDRFLLRLRMGYPNAADEDAILARFEADDPLASLQPVVESSDLVRMSALLPSVHCEPSVRQYVVRVVHATREHAAVELGASPRASLALFRAARALAAVRGRDYVIPDDVQAMAVPVLAHRLTLSSQSRLRGRDAEGLVRELIEEIPVPVEG
jgi:MoxR-like ATPase